MAYIPQKVCFMATRKYKFLNATEGEEETTSF